MSVSFCSFSWCSERLSLSTAEREGGREREREREREGVTIKMIENAKRHGGGFLGVTTGYTIQEATHTLCVFVR